MTRYHYVIRDAQNNIVHSSKDGVPGKKGFDDPIKANDDGNLIMNMKYPTEAYYVQVYDEEYEEAPAKESREDAIKRIAATGGPFATQGQNREFIAREAMDWQRDSFKKDLLDAINHTDAIDTFISLSKGGRPYRAEDMEEVIEKLKVSLDNMRKLL